MGATNTKNTPKGQTEITSNATNTMQEYKEHLNNISTAYSSVFGRTNTVMLNEILQKTNMPENIQQFVTERHVALLKILNKYVSSHDGYIDESRNDVLHAIDLEVSEMLQSSKAPDILTTLEPEVRNKIQSVQDTMKVLYRKYRFFEFKYVQLNMFVMVLIANILNIFESSVKVNKNRLAAMDQKIKKDFAEFARGLSLLDNDSDVNIKTIINMSDNLKTRLLDGQAKLSEQVTNVKDQQQAFLDIIDKLLNEDDSFLEAVSQKVNALKQKKSQTSNKT
jgi:hypothetical protein